MAPHKPFADREATLEAMAAHISRGKVEVYRRYGMDVVMGARAGTQFFDAFDDRPFFNCHCNGGVFNLGHRHPKVIAALREALDSLDIGNHHLPSGLRAELARRLAKTTDDALPCVVFGVGGGEAIDLALKVTRGVTGRRKVISALGGYHGHTGLAVAAGDAQYREPFGASLHEFVQVPFDDLDAMRAAVDGDTAAVLLEPIPATLGMPVPSPGYLAGVEETCRAHGARLIIDEVQTGLGRTGRMWAYQHEGVTPDALVTGKGLSGGVYPIAATLLSEELARIFDEHPFAHISTFGGAELGCVAALAALDIVEAPGFLEHVTALSERFGVGLASAPFELRRRGLMMGLAFPVEDAGMMAAKMLYDAGIFALYANNDTRVLQFLPPLVLTDAEADELIERVREVFRAMA